MYASVQVCEMPLKTRFVLIPCDAVDAGRRLPFQLVDDQRSRSMVTWCSSAVNRTRLSRLAVSRMRSSAGDTLSQLCVWHVLLQTALPLAPPLPSITSAAVSAALFGNFSGTMGESDFLWPCIIGLRVRPSRCGPLGHGLSKRPASGYPGSRAGGFPSPLLDWTSSPFVAAYFAFSRARDASEVAVYAYRERHHSIKIKGSNLPNIFSFGPLLKTHKRHFRRPSHGRSRQCY